MSLDGQAPPFIRGLQKVQLRLSMCALLIMMLVTVSDVLLRYAFGRPIHGAYDIVEVLLVVFVFHGMASAFLKRDNIVIDLIDQFVSPRVSFLLVRSADIVGILALIVIAWAMTAPAFQAYEYGDRKLELGLPVYIVWIFALAGMAGTIVCAFGALLAGRVAQHVRPL